MDNEINDVHATTPTGETGVGDMRDSMEGHGEGRVADAAGVKSTKDLTDTPTADDPYGTMAEAAKILEMEQASEGPAYERGQGTADQSTGGSSDPNNSLTHANSGDETEHLRGDDEHERS